MSENVLKPCPFCGEQPDYDGVFVNCLTTGCFTSMEDDLIENWNRRPIEDALRQRIAELEAAQKWIPVGERLPEARQRVLVANKNRFFRPTIAIYAGMIDVRHVWICDYSDEYITHWMELPSLPEVKE